MAEPWPEEETPTGKQHPVRCPNCRGSGMAGVEPIEGATYGPDGGGAYRLTKCGTCKGDGFIGASQMADWQLSRNSKLKETV